MSTPAAKDPSAFPLAGGSGAVPGVPGPQRAQGNGAATRGPTRPVAVGKLSLSLALMALLGFVAADLGGLLPLAFAALPLGLLLGWINRYSPRARVADVGSTIFSSPPRKTLLLAPCGVHSRKPLSNHPTKIKIPRPRGRAYR